MENKFTQKQIHEAYLIYWKNYREKNKEKLRNYQREYSRKRRAKDKTEK